MDINKVFIELKYNESLMFNEMRYLNEIKSSLSNLLPEFNYDSNNKVLNLVNSESHYIVSISSNRMTIDYDEPGDFNTFSELSKNVFQIVLNKLEIYNFTRVGIRSLRGENKKNNNESINSIRKNFIKLQDDEIKMLNENLTNVGVLFSFKKDKYIVNLSFNPNSFRIVEMRNNAIIKDESKFQVLIDSDIYREGIITYDELVEEFLNDFISINNDCIDKFWNKVGRY